MSSTAPTSSLIVEQLTIPTDSTVEQINRLLEQKKPNAKPLSLMEVWLLLDAAANKIFITKDGDTIVGVMVVVTDHLLTGVSYRIEDMMADPAYRKRGVERLLLLRLLGQLPPQVKRVVVTCDAQDAWLRRLFKDFGFDKPDEWLFELHHD